MDDIVIKAMGKWPNVPACYGWLGLDARGDWYLRDLTVQAQGRFPQIKGEKIVHSKWIAFMGRNYAADANGCWFFQNGPQRVFVELEVTPWVFRFGKTVAELISHTGAHRVCGLPARRVRLRLCENPNWPRVASLA